MLKFKPRSGLEQIEEYKVATVPDADIIVNANETNWPLAPSAVNKIKEQLDNFAFNRYPPMHAESMCQILAQGLRVDPDTVILGNGSSELLEKACYAFGGVGRKIAFPYPSFSMYQEYAQLADSIPAPYPLTKDGYVDGEAVIEFCRKEKPALLIICNPNNPTGNYTPLAVMEKILANVECPVIMDEAYMEFVDPEDKLGRLSTLSLLNEYDNFLCFRTFSKAYGLAGLRVGYGTGSPVLIKVMQKVLLPYHVNAFSLLAAQIVYQEPELLKSRVSMIIDERNKMNKALTELGFRLYPSSTNFIMFLPSEELAFSLAKYGIRQGYKLEGGNEVMAGAVVFSQLLGAKILVRDFTRHPALPGAIRLSLGTADENEKIAALLKEICTSAREA
jgi:histidinol-phosphate aminotransferase